MNIQEATKTAQLLGEGMYRVGWPPLVYVIPTNTSACCLLIQDRSQERSLAARWHPNLNDLLADDWMVKGSMTFSDELGKKIDD